MSHEESKAHNEARLFSKRHQRAVVTSESDDDADQLHLGDNKPTSDTNQEPQVLKPLDFKKRVKIAKPMDNLDRWFENQSSMEENKGLDLAGDQGEFMPKPKKTIQKKFQIGSDDEEKVCLVNAADP